MGERPGHEWEERVLCYEDLSEEEQRLTDAWLKDHPAAREHLALLRAKEQASRDPVPFRDGVLFEDTILSDEETAAEQASLADLERRLSLTGSRRSGTKGGPTGTVTRFPAGAVKWAPWLGALAAVLIAALLLPLATDNDDLISGLSAHGLESVGGQVRSPGVADRPLGVLVTGQAFELEFHLEQQARVVVVHVDPLGVVERIVPDPAGSAFPVLPGGENHRFPGRDSGENWILGPGAGTESFLMVAHRGETPDLASLDAGLVSAVQGGMSREKKVAAVADLLANWGHDIEIVEFNHVD